MLTKEGEGREASIPAATTVAALSQHALLLALERNTGVHPGRRDQLPEAKPLLAQLLNRVQPGKQPPLEVREHVGVVGLVQSQYLVTPDGPPVEQRLEQAVPRHEAEVHVLARAREDESGLLHPRLAVLRSGRRAGEGFERQDAGRIEPLRDSNEPLWVGAPARGSVGRANELRSVAPGRPLVSIPPSQRVVGHSGSDEDVLDDALGHHGGVGSPVATDLSSAGAHVERDRKRVFDEVPTEGPRLPPRVALRSDGKDSR